MPRVYCASLGCSKNLVDTEVMLGLLKKKGFNLTGSPQNADIILVNTCAFIQDARQESINILNEMAALKIQEKQLLIVTGCLAQQYQGNLLAQIPEIDAVAGPGEINRIYEIFEKLKGSGKKVIRVGRPTYLYHHLTPRLRVTLPHTSVIKISEGCNRRCSFCNIPFLRGRMRSRKIESIVLEAKSLAEQGVKEIQLVGQDTSSYGLELYGKHKTAEMLQAVSRVKGMEWIRLLYLFPDISNKEIFEIISQEPKVCKYVDIPLQHIDKRILRTMKRPGSEKETENLIWSIRKKIPGVSIRTTFIVGFPGETEGAFKKLCRFVQRVQFDKLGVFCYSSEKNTAASKLYQTIAPEIQQERKHILMTLQRRISLKKATGKIGDIVRVILDHPGHDVNLPENLVGNKLKKRTRKNHEKASKGSIQWWVGRSEHDAPEIDGEVYFSAPKTLNIKPGQFVQVRVTNALDYDLIGRYETNY